MLAFASDRTGEPQIFITDADGVPHQLTRDASNHSPTWTAALQ
jgi:Tol biopolymer transport system component